VVEYYGLKTEVLLAKLALYVVDKVETGSSPRQTAGRVASVGGTLFARKGINPAKTQTQQ